MEFKLINPKNENGFIQAIEFNFEELKAELTKGLEKYQNLTFTEETIKDAKETKANLNKFKEAIETRRKEIKKLCMKPYEAFEVKIKELTALIDEPIKTISDQLQNFEDKRINEKAEEIKNFYDENIGNLSNILPLEKIYNQKWLNSTYKLEKIQAEILETIAKVNGDLRVIADLKLESDLELQVKDTYLQTLDFSMAMAEKNRLENLKKAINELEPQTECEPEIIEEPAPITAETKIYYREFWVKGTKNQLIKLSEFLKNNGIEYGGIEKCQLQTV